MPIQSLCRGDGSEVCCSQNHHSSIYPSPTEATKPREHTSCLECHLQLWSEGEFDDLLNEGKALQGHLPKIHNTKDAEDHLARSFSNLMFEGKTNAALQLLTNRSKGGVLHLDSTIPSNSGGSTTVVEALKSKHPISHPATAEAIQTFEGDEAPSDVHPVVFDSIDAAVIHSAALRTTGADELMLKAGGDSVQPLRLHLPTSATP